MFTGIIETTGVVKCIYRADKSLTIGVAPRAADFNTAVGASISINGACLTVEQIRGNVLFFTAVYETLQRTTVQHARQGDTVNLERALKPESRLDGHFVLGHVDAVGTIMSDKRVGNSIIRSIKVPSEIRKYCAMKGSIAVDGISLTIAACNGELVDISLIPQTLSATTMGMKRQGDDVNIECDVLARYIESLAVRSSHGIDHEPTRHDVGSDSLLCALERSGL